MAVNKVNLKDLLVCFSSDLSYQNKGYIPVSFPPTHRPHPPKKDWVPSKKIYTMMHWDGLRMLSHDLSRPSKSGLSVGFVRISLSISPKAAQPSLAGKLSVILSRLLEFGGTCSLSKSNLILLVDWCQTWLMPRPCFCSEMSFRVSPLLELHCGQFLGPKFSCSFSIHSFTL